jgi:hypothetical protein
MRTVFMFQLRICIIDDGMDEDDIETYGKKLKRSLSNLKFKDLTILHVHGSFKGENGEETMIYIQVLEVPEMEHPYVINLLKKGDPVTQTNL